MENKKPQGKIKVVTKTKAKDYTAPNLFKIAVEILADDPEWMPVYTDPNWADVKVIVPVLNHQGVQALRLNHRTTETLDCGFTLKIPAGFRLIWGTKPRWTRRGLLVSDAYLENDRLKLMITNIGHETPLIIDHKEIIAHIGLAPVYFFDWNQK